MVDGPAAGSGASSEWSREGLSRRLWRHGSGRVGLLIIGFYTLVAVVGPLLVNSNPSVDLNYQNLNNNLLEPTWFGEFPLGTDQLGRDVLVRLILGARYTILIGLGAAAAGLVLGITLGAVSGYSRGWIDLTIQRFIDIILAFPHFLLALALIAVFGPGIRNLMIALAVTSFPRTVRLIRASVLSVREQPYVEAARSMGVSERRILWRHIVPNASTPAVAQAPLELATAILTATGLGFLGLGVQSPIPEWGAMMGEGRDFMLTRPGLVTLPGLCIVGVILAFNLLGDGIRDVFDPRLSARGSRKRLRSKE